MSKQAWRRRVDVFRHDTTMVAVARDDTAGSIGLLFAGHSVATDRRHLGASALGWLDTAQHLPIADPPLRYPDDLLPEDWTVNDWFQMMSRASLVVIEVIDARHLRLRPYKNLAPIGEDFSHDGGHGLDCEPSPDALGAGLRAALDVSAAISRVHPAPATHLGEPILIPEIWAALKRLGARLFDRPPHTEVVEVTEGFVTVPAALRQLLFDVTWRPDSRCCARDGTVWRMTWFPQTQTDGLRSWPLMEVARSEQHRAILRLDSRRPHDPEIYTWQPTSDPVAALGVADQAPPAGQRLSAWLAQLEPIAS